MEKEYIYNASIVDADTDDIIARIQSFSQEGLEEEMGKSKFTGAVERYETPEVFRTEQDYQKDDPEFSEYGDNAGTIINTLEERN